MFRFVERSPSLICNSYSKILSKIIVYSLISLNCERLNKCLQMQAQKNFPPFPFINRFFGWSNNQIDIVQINGLEINLISYALDPQRFETQEQAGWLRIKCHTERRNGVGVWGFKGEKGNSQGNQKSQCLVIRCLPCLCLIFRINIFFGNNHLSGPGLPSKYYYYYYFFFDCAGSSSWCKGFSLQCVGFSSCRAQAQQL